MANEVCSSCHILNKLFREWIDDVENEIDAISGATITTNAVTNGVNLGLYYFNEYS